MDKKLTIAFDIDDCILVPNIANGFGNDTPNYETITVFKWFQKQGHHMILWSGSGIDWAKTWGEKFGLQPFEVRRKEASKEVDIAFDDCDVELAKVNIKVKRINNSISREDWNKNKKL